MSRCGIGQTSGELPVPGVDNHYGIPQAIEAYPQRVARTC